MISKPLGDQSSHHLAQMNVGRLVRPLDDEANAEFVAALGPINAIAESTPGFVWRLTDDDGNSSSYVRLPGVDDERTVVNYSVWETIESLEHFMYKSGHMTYLRRRGEWFEKATEEMTVCWWHPAGVIPTVDEGYERLLGLRADGPSERGWLMKRPWPHPSAG